jgi:hypothetical protein
MIEKVSCYTVRHDLTKESGTAHFTTTVFADSELLSDLGAVSVTVNSNEFIAEVFSKDGERYPQAGQLYLSMNFLSGISIIGIYPDIVVSFEGKRVNFVQSFTYKIDLAKENRLPLIHFAML